MCGPCGGRLGSRRGPSYCPAFSAGWGKSEGPRSRPAFCRCTPVRRAFDRIGCSGAVPSRRSGRGPRADVRPARLSRRVALAEAMATTKRRRPEGAGSPAFSSLLLWWWLAAGPSRRLSPPGTASQNFRDAAPPNGRRNLF
jgi:hypothetical protein